ncbi:MAG TPA: ribonuclease HI family protein [Candidatus Angelobacter sp.]|nr:ribonuclease HI family protein [Candidatus Angelobacter sp.]
MSQENLFSHTAPPSEVVIANIDGGSRGNPGPAAYGVIVRDTKGKILRELGEYLGLQTNNFAEYSGLLAALEYAHKEKIPSLKILSDSELLVKQMKGQYRVKSPGLVPLFERAKSLARRLSHFSIEHVRRERNQDADRMVNQVLDRQERKL